MSSKTRLLIIDDDPDAIEVLRLILVRKGLEVLGSCTGIEGFNVARRELPDVVLLDIMMPDIDGYEVYRRLRLDRKTRNIPVIFVSAKSRGEDVRKGMSLGAQGYVTKPFKAAELMDKINKVIMPETPA